MTKLEIMLKYVSDHNNFYKERIKTYGITNPLDITQWPVLTREELQDSRYGIFSDGYMSKYFLHELRHHSSSGSSGTPVNIYWSKNDYLRSMASLWRMRTKFYKITPSCKKIMFSISKGKGQYEGVLLSFKDFDNENGKIILVESAISAPVYEFSSSEIMKFDTGKMFYKTVI